VDAVALVARVILAGVLAAAGAAKLRDLPGSRQAMEGFGVPTPLAPAAGIALPIVEIALAVMLVTTSLVTEGAALSLGLLLAMSAALARLLLRGESPECHCFGAVHSQPVGPGTLARSGALALAAAFVAVYGAGSAIGTVGPFGAEALVPLLAGIAAAIVGRPRERRHAPLFPDAPPPGSPAPRFELAYAHQGRASLDSMLARGAAVALVFVDAACGPCRALLGSLARWQETFGEELSIAVISKGARDANRALCLETGLPDVLLQEDSEVSRAYGVLPTPSAVLVAADGTLASNPAAGAPGVEALMRLALEEASARRAAV
jgi:peroxiredoxin